jgi:hypothetical protein
MKSVSPSWIKLAAPARPLFLGWSASRHEFESAPYRGSAAPRAGSETPQRCTDTSSLPSRGANGRQRLRWRGSAQAHEEKALETEQLKEDYCKLVEAPELADVVLVVEEGEARETMELLKTLSVDVFCQHYQSRWDGGMPLVAERRGIWHWWPVNSHLMASEPERERESPRELY